MTFDTNCQSQIKKSPRRVKKHPRVWIQPKHEKVKELTGRHCYPRRWLDLSSEDPCQIIKGRDSHIRFFEPLRKNHELAPQGLANSTRITREALMPSYGGDELFQVTDYIERKSILPSPSTEDHLTHPSSLLQDKRPTDLKDQDLLIHRHRILLLQFW